MTTKQDIIAAAADAAYRQATVEREPTIRATTEQIYRMTEAALNAVPILALGDLHIEAITKIRDEVFYFMVQNRINDKPTQRLLGSIKEELTELITASSALSTLQAPQAPESEEK